MQSLPSTAELKCRLDIKDDFLKRFLQEPPPSVLENRFKTLRKDIT